MDEQRLSAGWFAVPALLLCLPIGTYVTGYFASGELIQVYSVDAPEGSAIARYRTYNSSWQVAIFQPLGRCEAWICGIPITITTIDQVPII